MKNLRVYFHFDQLLHKPVHEWAFGEKIAHPETTTRAENILYALESSGRYEMVVPTELTLKELKETHDRDLLTLYKSAETQVEGGTFYPSVFPKRNQTVGNPKDVKHAGFYCFDSGTPLTNYTWLAAKWSASCAVTAAEWVASGKGTESYSLCRPPGHHATRDLFGGYCYFNNAALAAKRLRKNGKVVILDIDFHHGNGTQSIFYKDPKVLFISIHGDPKEFFPYYWGHTNEKGSGPGLGFNHNITIASGCDGQEYMKVLLAKVIPMIKSFDPSSLVISAGFDTYKNDPIGKFTLESNDYFDMAEILAKLQLPTVIVQEGGYCTDMLGTNVDLFLSGFMAGRQSVLL